MTHRLLSYPLAEQIPIYGGKASLNIQPVKSITKGDSANVFSFVLQNHWGTHIDAPNHFFNDGKKITDYLPEFWFFNHPQVVSVSLKPGEILSCGPWLDKVKKETDLLLFQSEWSQRRNLEEYSLNNPGIAPDVALRLRKEYPNVRVIGMDWISVSAYQNRELGRQAHRAFLDAKGVNQPILLLEDMDLSQDLKGLQEVVVMPLLIKGVDSAPCTVIGRVSK